MTGSSVHKMWRMTGRWGLGTRESVMGQLGKEGEKIDMHITKIKETKFIQFMVFKNKGVEVKVRMLIPVFTCTVIH